MLVIALRMGGKDRILSIFDNLLIQQLNKLLLDGTSYTK